MIDESKNYQSQPPEFSKTAYWDAHDPKTSGMYLCSAENNQYIERLTSLIDDWMNVVDGDLIEALSKGYPYQIAQAMTRRHAARYLEMYIGDHFADPIQIAKAYEKAALRHLWLNNANDLVAMLEAKAYNEMAQALWPDFRRDS